MLVNDRTRRALEYRRVTRQWVKDGYEKIGEGGGKLWEIYRGYRIGQIIKDVKIAPGGMELFVKIEPKEMK